MREERERNIRAHCDVLDLVLGRIVVGSAVDLGNDNGTVLFVFLGELFVVALNVLTTSAEKESVSVCVCVSQSQRVACLYLAVAAPWRIELNEHIGSGVVYNLLKGRPNHSLEVQYEIESKMSEEPDQEIEIKRGRFNQG